MTNRDVYSQIVREYEELRDAAAARAEARRTQVYATLPEVLQIDNEIAKLGLGLATLALAGDVKAIEDARTRSAALRLQRNQLIDSTYGANYLDMVYECNICKDTGHVVSGGASTRCNCMKQRLLNAYYALSNMQNALAEENFDHYDLRLFSTEVVSGEGISPHANMQTVYRLSTKFVANFGKEFTNLLMYGEPGLGKTFVCHCIAKDLLDAGNTVLYQTAPRLCKTLEDYRFNRDTMQQPDAMLAAIDEVDLLIIDDLGAEISTIITSAALFDIINQRLLMRKPTVISTNLTPSALEAQYSERLVSRFFGNYQMLKFFGEDIRVKKKYGGLRM